MTAEPLSCVATFVAPRTALDLAKQLPDITRLIPGSGSAAWLDPGYAVDIPFTASAEALGPIRAAVAEWRRDKVVDVIVQEVAYRRKALLLADMDSTMIGQECIDELADFAGLKSVVSAITERAMRGELAFEPALRERVALLKGLPIGIIDEVLAHRVTLTAGGPTLVSTMRAHGAYCALVSGGFTVFTGPIAARIGFDENRGNVLGVEADQFSGHVNEPIVGRAAKLDALIELRARFGLAREETLAVGDGANDLAMIAEAGLGVAFRAKPAVAAAAGACIDHNDLTALLYAQGYARSTFVLADQG